MNRQRLYNVPLSAWLHVERPTEEAATTAEEKVRQWCAHELIRAYGYCINELSFEHVAKVGSKTYRVDILIQRDGRPFAVVECKEPKHTRHEKALEQAESYALARDIRCEFVLYTNGDSWLVRRLIGKQWSPVLDLPTASIPPRGNLIDGLLHTMGDVEPLLANLDEPLAKDDAQALILGLQKFFHGENLLSEQFDQELLSAADNLLRVLWAPVHDQHYRLGKFTIASSLVERFRKRTGCGHEIFSDYTDVDSVFWFSELGIAVSSLCDTSNENTSYNWRLLRFIRALLAYGRQIDERRGDYPPIPPDVWLTLRSVLEFGFLHALGIKLPDPLETKTDSNVKHLCQDAWEKLREENKSAISGRAS